ncbi:MAG: hypothetical protein ACO1SX_16310 [Actinomycetota bacterium]
MPKLEPEKPYTQRDVQNMLHERLPGGKHNWLRDPEGNAAVEAYGSSYLPAQPLYVNYRPSTVKMQVRFTPRRISLSRENELWAAAEAARGPLRAAGVSSRRQAGHTQETERDEQWVVSIPERLSEAGYETLEKFVILAGSCMGIEPPETE